MAGWEKLRVKNSGNVNFKGLIEKKAIRDKGENL